MSNEIYLSLEQAAELIGIPQENIYKEIQSGNLTAIEHPDMKRKYQVVARSELSRLYGNVYIPNGYLEYADDRTVDFVRNALEHENEQLRKKLEDTERREQYLTDRLKITLQNHEALVQIHADLTKTLGNLTTILQKITEVERHPNFVKK